MNPNIKTPTLNQITSELDNLFNKRTGGSINFRGVHYQILYTTYLILHELSDSSSTKSIRMEGIEDIDLNKYPVISTNNQYIQVKSSINKMDAGVFWKLGVLQNFLETYIINPESEFKLVYNMNISDGNLSNLINKKGDFDFWIQKLKAIAGNIEYLDFLNKISYERKTANELYENILKLLFKSWDINKGTEMQFLRSLFFNVLIWSKDRSEVSHYNINTLFQEIKDSFSKSPVNKAFQNNWITNVIYDDLRDNSNFEEDFYDGKATKPIHISLGLPARRKIWEKMIQENIAKSDVTVIKSSSGQGKSTLAWQVGYNLNKNENYVIYQLHTCKDINEVNSIVEFLESRLLIGEKLLVIIDGLSTMVGVWSDVVQRMYNYSVKYIITARQEDWYRFGADMSRVNLTNIDISLSISEAKDIFEQFKRKQKIHPEIREWQPLWEQVHNKGLLIEYTYLLTRGQMIEERLSTQIKYLNDSKSSDAKLEILRMVSLADCLNIKLQTKKLLKYIKVEIGFDQDRGEILNELEKEYFLSFEGQYIEGLHPVRSNHLKELLHKNLPLEESLINLFKILEKDYQQDFFINIPLVLTSGNKISFYNNLAEQLYECDFSDMVFALDGIMHGEPQQYWVENKEHFDQAYNIGAIELFSTVSTPFTETTLLDEMVNILGDKGTNFKWLSDLKKALPIYNFDDSDLVIFATALVEKLKKRTFTVSSYKGLEFLTKWFHSLKIPLSLPLIKSDIKIAELIKMNFQEAKELMLFFQINNPLLYKNFVNQHREILISYLVVHTDSLIIKEVNNEVYVEYLLLDKDANEANNFSVSRIESLYAFLPFYNKYHAEAIMLPFPSEEMIYVVKQDSIKHLSPEIIGNSFEGHLNKIWTSVIQKNYQEDSAYRWQSNILNIRKIAIEWSKTITRIIDALLEANKFKITSGTNTLLKIKDQLDQSLIRKKYPTYYKINNKNLEEIDINDWLDSLHNINSQVFNIFLPKDEQERIVALINFKAVFFNLQKMQDAFKQAEARTIAYFDSESICNEENKWYHRLYITISYYFSHIPLENEEAVPVGRKAVEEWWESEKNRKINELKKTLSLIEVSSDYRFVYPNRFEETETLTYCTFGILDFDFSNQQDVEILLMNLSSLENISCDFISIISVKDNTAINGLRFKHDFFKAMGRLMDGDENVDMNGLAPLPIFKADKNTIKTLSGITLPEVLSINNELEIKAQILFDLWKLSEYRRGLNKESDLELKKLREIELDIISKINDGIENITKISVDLKKFILSGLDFNCIYSQSEILEQLFKLK
ncbi:hypothetical protein HZQ44_11960 [Elizabethkingia anophelis]|nr:hypothetical protein [Elizabethkingia anophelis]MCT3913188.1 hypothetical protein [Elizabethkingia anophelis]MCT4312199.1 hypothetical protein [Elizabethkingia anophelis]